jgi:hypothetical protein
MGMDIKWRTKRKCDDLQVWFQSSKLELSINRFRKTAHIEI